MAVLKSLKKMHIFIRRQIALILSDIKILFCQKQYEEHFFFRSTEESNTQWM